MKKTSRILEKIHKNRDNLHTVNMSNKLERCLHSTYLSHLPKKKFYYKFKKHVDKRGEFAELIKQNNNTPPQPQPSQNNYGPSIDDEVTF